MIKTLIACFYCTSVLNAPAKTDSSALMLVESKITQVKQQLAPDRRIAAFKITAKDEDGKILLNGATTDSKAKNQLLSILQESNVNYVDNIELLPSAKLGNKLYGVANMSVCNNRFEPKQESEMATQMILGTPVDALSRQGKWIMVRTPDGYISWTENDGVALMDENEFKAWQKADKVIFTDYFGHSYQEANAKATIVSDLVKGDILKVLKEEKGFYKVEYPDTRIAYVEKNKALPLSRWIKALDPSAENIISTAKTMLGTPYLWGGTSIKGVDCSGFMKTSFFLNGIILPRDASQQVFAGDKIDLYENNAVNIEKSLQNLKPGDLLFFSGKMDGDLNAKIVHVGMYIGNGEFIHSSGMVKINSFKKDAANYAEWQTRTLVAARRILTSTNTENISTITTNSYYNSTTK